MKAIDLFRNQPANMLRSLVKAVDRDLTKTFPRHAALCEPSTRH
ncbi:hypothetical protein [Burkholderia ubonensis]|nr:hypothetical protein [Burkholderia ubonensis]